MKKLFLILIISLFILPIAVAAQIRPLPQRNQEGLSPWTPDEKGLTIAKEADRRDEGFGDFTAKMIMILKNRHGQKSKRQIRLRTLEVADDGDKSLTIFDTPKDVKGTAFLNFTHKRSEERRVGKECRSRGSADH